MVAQWKILIILVTLPVLLGAKPGSKENSDGDSVTVSSGDSSKNTVKTSNGDSDENTVNVIGRRYQEVFRPKRAGQSSVMSPKGASRFETKRQLERNSSVALPETGRLTASGFVIPRIRGQDVKLTEIFLGDIQLQDPYSGMPLASDLDLRSFGELALYQGVSPPRLPSVNPVGIMQYRLKPVTDDKTKGGLDYGDPYGVSGWLMNSGRLEFAGEDHNLRYRLYGRSHVTDGKYPYYGDNGTPYNENDDVTAVRENNARRSQQAVPWITYQNDRHKLQVLGLWQGSKAGIPSKSAHLKSRADKRHRSSLISTSWSYRPEPFALLVPDRLTLTTIRRHSRRNVTDPTHVILPKSDSTRFSVETRRAAGSVNWLRHPVRVYLRADGARADVENSTDLDRAIEVSRTSRKFYGGFSAEMPGSVLLEGKASTRALEDEVVDVEALYQEDPLASRPEQNRRVGGSSLAVAWHPSRWVLYGQWGRVKRSPSLLEQFGNGAAVRAQPGLDPELTVHQEAGLSYSVRNSSRWRLGASVFRDHTNDKIVFLPSVSQTVSAHNIETTRVSGGSVEGGWASAFGTKLDIAYTRLLPYDLGDSGERRMLAGVAAKRASASVQQQIQTLRLRWMSRYQSQVYRDRRNAIVVPSYWIHDVSVDHEWTVWQTTWETGLAVNNLFDVRGLPISAPGTQNRGKTSYSKLSGHPLPGRHWKLSVTATY